ncbi:uncharacterized protein LOC133474512 [Phyllopteryx taeniolatus]|uniref:uncharacterized protein LOC133474512 n=1 Tax=Phyllopteryx taeniolatus TaxID=161469 RepID=UPI002AD4C61B|nr:uncharacterized protein LOC133474512 [Phyllopteryx taeniolatus]
MFLPCVPRRRPNHVHDRMNRPEQDPAGRTWRHPGRHQTASHRPQPAIHTYPPPAEEATAAPIPANRQLRQAPVPAPRQLRQAPAPAALVQRPPPVLVPAALVQRPPPVLAPTALVHL